MLIYSLLFCLRVHAGFDFEPARLVEMGRVTYIGLEHESDQFIYLQRAYAAKQKAVESSARADNLEKIFTRGEQLVKNRTISRFAQDMRRYNLHRERQLAIQFGLEAEIQLSYARMAKLYVLREGNAQKDWRREITEERLILTKLEVQKLESQVSDTRVYNEVMENWQKSGKFLKTKEALSDADQDLRELESVTSGDKLALLNSQITVFRRQASDLEETLKFLDKNIVSK